MNASYVLIKRGVKNIEYNKEIHINNQVDINKEYHLIVEFEIIELQQESGWVAGDGKHIRFAKFIKTQEDRWAIRQLATSP